jgi:hypothetical protein
VQHTHRDLSSAIMMAPGNDGNPGDSGNPGRQDPAGSRRDIPQPSISTGQMRAPARRVRRRSDPAPGAFVMHWKLDKVLINNNSGCFKNKKTLKYVDADAANFSKTNILPRRIRNAA